MSDDEPETKHSDEPVAGGARPRVVCAELRREPSRALVEIVLERDGVEYRSEISAVGGEELLLRLAARETVRMLGEIVGNPDHFKLIGIKNIHAFDAQVVLVCVQTADAPDRKLVGCVPGPDGLIRGVVQAVLNATNRIVESYS